MRVCVLTNLFPNSLQQGRGIFNLQQFKSLSQHCELKVIAPLPKSPKWLGGQKGKINAVPEQENMAGFDVYHPRHFVFPKCGRRFYGEWMYRDIKGTVLKVAEAFKPHVLLSTWAYPDAYAGVRLAKDLQLPSIVKVHGSDVNVYSRFGARRKLMIEAFRDCNRIIAVSSALKKKIESFGIDASKIDMISNGIDTGLFQPMDKNECRRKLSLLGDQKHIVYIGNLVDIKGVEYLIDSMSRLESHVHLHIIGDGVRRKALEGRARHKGFEKRITFHGRIAHEEIARWMNAADVFCLPSLNEGCPNVIVEAMATHVPIVATRVGGIPELVNDYPEATLVPVKNARALAEAIRPYLKRRNKGDKNYTVPLSWDENAKKIFNVLQKVTGEQS